MRGQRPLIYGDGKQTRDFTYISNVVDANLRAAESSKGVGEIINARAADLGMILLKATLFAEIYCGCQEA